MISPYSKTFYSLMLKEMHVMGPYHLEKICKKENINPFDIKEENLPYVVKSISNILLAFKGKQRAEEFLDDVKAKYDLEGVISQVQEPDKKIGKIIDIGDTEADIGNIAGAVEYYNKALQSARSENDIKRESQALRKLGAIEVTRSDFLKAYSLLQDAEKLHKKFNDDLEKAKLFRDLTTIYWRGGILKKALQLIDRAIELAENIKMDRLKGELMIRKSMVLKDMGKIDSSIELLKGSIQILEKEEDFLNLSRAYNNIAVILRHEREMSETFRYLELSLGLAENLESPRMKAYALANLAKYHSMMGDVEKAKRNSAISKGIFTEINEKYMLALLRGLDAWISDQEDDINGAEKALEDSIGMFKDLNVPIDLAWECFEAGKLYQKWKRPEASDFFKNAIEIFESLGNKEGVKRAEHELGRNGS